MRPEAAINGEPWQQHERVRTSCGRELTVGRLALGDESHPAERVFVDLGNCVGCDGSAWAGLTATEARRLALALLSHASAAERESGPRADTAGRAMVRHAGGDAYAVTMREHAVLVDQPEADGGQDLGPTPTELLVASLASCVGFYAGRYLVRHGLNQSGLGVAADFEMASDRPARISDVRLRIIVPAGMPPERRDALLAVASHCTVHNTLRQQPSISIDVD